MLGGKTREGGLAYTHAGGKDFAAVEDDVRRKMAEGFKVVRCQVAIPGNVGTYGTGGGKEAASATWEQSRSGAEWADGGPMPLVNTWEPRPYLRTIPTLFQPLRAD